MKIFDAGIYRETVKRLKIAGVAATVTVAILNALFFVTASGSIISRWENATNFTFMPLIWMILGFTPFILYVAFGFLNKRNEADFYHSLPIPRKAIFLSILAGAYTWIFAAIFVSGTLNGTLALLFGVEFEAGNAFYIPILLMMLGVLYVGAFTMIGITLSGTRFTNLSVSAMAVVIRLTPLIIYSMAQERLRSFDLDYSSVSLFGFGMKYCYTNLFFGVYGVSDIKADIWVWLFNLAITAILFVIAYFGFIKRKSESAGVSTPSKTVQRLTGFFAAFPFLLYGICELMQARSLRLVEERFPDDYERSYYWQPGGIRTAVILAGFGLVVFLFYELISTKKIKKALKSLPIFCIALGAAILTGMAVQLICRATLSQKYEASDVKEVKIISPNNYRNDYSIYMLEEVATDNEAAREIVAKAFTEVNKYELDGYFPSGYGTYITVVAKFDNGWNTARQIYFEQDELEALIGSLLSEEGAEDIYSELPKIPRNGFNVTISGGGYNPDNFTDKLGILDTFAEEFGSLSAEEKKDYFTRKITDYYTYSESGGYTVYYFTEDGKGAKFFVPESFEKTLAAIKHAVVNEENLLDFIKEIADGKHDGDIKSGNFNDDLIEAKTTFFTPENIFDSYFSLDFRYASTDDEYLKDCKELLALITKFMKVEPNYGDDRIVSFFYNSTGFDYALTLDYVKDAEVEEKLIELCEKIEKYEFYYSPKAAYEQ